MSSFTSLAYFQTKSKTLNLIKPLTLGYPNLILVY
jgi:hypothetical protein